MLAKPAFSNRENNPYNAVLYDGMAALGVRVDEYGARRVLARRYDAFHVHWPEASFNTRSTAAGAILAARALLVAIDWLRARGARLVWTVHNLRAHERRYPEPEETFWRAFTARVDGFIALAESGVDAARERFPALARRPGVVVPHPHYRGQYPDTLSRAEARARLGVPSDARVVLFFGRVLPYKNVPELVRVVRALPRRAGELVQLRIAGKPGSADVERELRRLADGAADVVLDLGHVPRARVQEHFRAADVVALPYRDILNSGSALLALSFDRPVLLPRLGAWRELHDLVGRDHVQTYDALTPDVVRAALEAARELPERTDGAHLSALAPDAIAARTLAAYETILAAPRVQR